LLKLPEYASAFLYLFTEKWVRNQASITQNLYMMNIAQQVALNFAAEAE
jgi:hypothetical protein